MLYFIGAALCAGISVGLVNYTYDNPRVGPVAGSVCTGICVFAVIMALILFIAGLCAVMPYE